jgi:homocitrate synthase NifV
VADASGRPVALNKSIVGEAVFTHEAGIHVDGLAKNSLNYESFSPTEIGREHCIVLGKHSGAAAVVRVYADLGIGVSDQRARAILPCIRKFAVEHKRAPGFRDLMNFYLGGVAQPTVATMN